MVTPNATSGAPETSPSVAYKTQQGTMLHGTIEDCLAVEPLTHLRGEVQLLLTSPPFPLNRKKKYGNLTGDAYVAWLAELAPSFSELLAPNGSIVMEIGNAWEPGRPTMSTLSLRALLAFLEGGDLKLCQQFISHNPARIPSPAQWVTIERIRVKDSFTHVWWMSNTDRPKSDNRRVLRPYSESMKKLLERQSYNAGERPSGHRVNAESFKKDHGGAIPPNVLSFSNTRAYDSYQDYCRERDITPHPARMPAGLAEFFVEFLTDPGDMVLDPFAGSNLTGGVAEHLGRRWIAVEPIDEYIAGSRGRFEPVPQMTPESRPPGLPPSPA